MDMCATTPTCNNSVSSFNRRKVVKVARRYNTQRKITWWLDSQCESPTEQHSTDFPSPQVIPPTPPQGDSTKKRRRQRRKKTMDKTITESPLLSPEAPSRKPNLCFSSRKNPAFPKKPVHQGVAEENKLPGSHASRTRKKTSILPKRERAPSRTPPQVPSISPSRTLPYASFRRFLDCDASPSLKAKMTDATPQVCAQVAVPST